jgi:large subunit ribosomal protein L3
MIKGAVPGHKGGWVMVRDAVKRPPKDVKSPGSVKKAEKANGSAASSETAAEAQGEG